MIKILMVIAPNNFQDEEFLKPKGIFEKSGFQVKVASQGVEKALGAFGTRVKVDLDLSQVDILDYDALVFVGGGGAAVYLHNETVLRLARAAYEKGKLMAAICLAPLILANAGILSGRKATVFPSEAGNLLIQGAEYSAEAVAVDGKIVTANGPEAASEFGKTIVGLLTRKSP